MKFQKSVLAAAVAAAVGVPPVVQADIVTATWDGAFTVLNTAGGFIPNQDTAPCMPGAIVACSRSAVTGTLTFDTFTGSGTGTVAPISFFTGGNAVVTGFSFQAIGNGFGGPGTLLLGNMGWDWNGTYGIPVSVVLDAAGFFGALLAGGVAVSQTITGGATPASDNGETFFANGAVLATTGWNTTTIPGSNLGSNPSGTLPLIANTVGGSPLIAGPGMGYNFNFDFLSVHITGCTDTGHSICAAAPIPIPATVWLFGSGLVGLAGIVRRRYRVSPIR